MERLEGRRAELGCQRRGFGVTLQSLAYVVRAELYLHVHVGRYIGKRALRRPCSYRRKLRLSNCRAGCRVQSPHRRVQLGCRIRNRTRVGRVLVNRHPRTHSADGVRHLRGSKGFGSDAGMPQLRLVTRHDHDAITRQTERQARLPRQFAARTDLPGPTDGWRLNGDIRTHARM